MEKRVGRKFKNPRGAILEGYRLEFNKKASGNEGVGYANVVPDKSSYVEGVLYEITEEGLQKLDEYEGYPNHYIRKELPVKIKESGKQIKAWVYIAAEDKVEEGLKPTRAYLNHLIKGEKFLSKDYVKFLKEVETID